MSHADTPKPSPERPAGDLSPSQPPERDPQKPADPIPEEDLEQVEEQPS